MMSVGAVHTRSRPRMDLQGCSLTTRVELFRGYRPSLSRLVRFGGGVYSVYHNQR